MKKRIFEKRFLFYVLIVGLILFIINVIRAYKTGITYDESYTYLNYVTNNPLAIIKLVFGRREVLANNHLINTFLISCLQMVSKVRYSELLIRLPNLLFYIIYFIFGYRLSKEYQHQYLCFNILAFNYGVHEYFGLGRGYGISCALVLMGLFYLKKWHNTSFEDKYLNWTYFFLALSCYANTSSLIIFASVIIYSQLYLLFDKGFKRNLEYTKKNLLVLLFLMVITLIVIYYHFKISSDGLPLYGGKKSFFQNVLVSLTELYGINKYPMYFTIGLLVTLGVIIWIYRKKVLKNYLAFVSIIYFIVLIIFTKVFNQMWMTGRLLIPIMPLVSLSLFEIFDDVNSKWFNYLFFVIAIIPFGYSLNINKTRDWENDYIVKEKAYEAYEKKDNSIIKPYLSNNALYFYRDKIEYLYGYDILENVN